MDAQPIRPPFVNCPHCGSKNDQVAERCTACGRWLVLRITDENPYAPPHSPEPKTSRGSFHIGSLMLLIALIAVCLALLVEIPGVGVVLLLVLAPASIRTVHGAWRDRGQGRPLSWDEKLWLFAASLGTVLVIELGTIAAFTVSCFPIGMFFFRLESPSIAWGMFLALGVGLTTAAFAGYHLIRQLWPRRNRRAPAQSHVSRDDPKSLP